MSVQPDPDLDGLFGSEPELRELAGLMQATPHPAGHLEPSAQFRMGLRRRLMREAWERASEPALPWYRRLVAPQPLAWAGAAVGALLIALTVVSIVHTPQGAPSQVTVMSPQNESQTVSQATPIELRFNQPMDPHTVQDAVKIQPPPGRVSYSWQEDNTRLTITPVHALAPNTQYEVTVQPSAQTRTHQGLAKPAKVSFVTIAPSPSPSSVPTSQPTSNPGALLNPHVLAPLGGGFRWSPDGSHLFVIGPGGVLQSWTVQGTATVVAPTGVTLIAVDPDGQPAYVAGGQITYGAVTVPGVQPIAIGFRQGGLVFATATDVETAAGKRIAAFSDQATAADISPAGDRLVYRAASGLHSVDMGSGRDTPIGPADGLGDWSPDGHHYAYSVAGTVAVTDGITTTTLATLPGVTGIAWSRGNQVLLATTTGLELMNGDGSQLSRLEDGAFGQPAWAPGATGSVAFRRSGELWVARLPNAVAGVVTPTTLSQDDLVNAFMAARKSQLGDQAQTFLDSAGKDAFGKVTLIYTDPSQSLARYYVLLSQPGRVVVRLVLSQGQALDETIAVQRDAAGRLWIHGVTEAGRTSFAVGPEIVRVAVASGQVQVYFDSDLSAASVLSGGVTIRQAGVPVVTQAAYDTTQKMVTLTVPTGLVAGTTYDLVVTGGLQDVAQRTAIPYDLQITGPSPSQSTSSAPTA